MKGFKKSFLSLLGLCALSASCMSTGFFGSGGAVWTEEVLLHDGEEIQVERTVERAGRHEPGAIPSISLQMLKFNVPGTGQQVVWEDGPSEGVRGSSFLPMQLEFKDEFVYLTAYPMGCKSYKKWGRPNPPYVVFRFEGNTWERIALEELPLEFRTPNLVISSPDIKIQQKGLNVVSADMVRELNSGGVRPELKEILRKPLSFSRCPEFSEGPKAPENI